MSEPSVPPSPTFTADSELHRGKSHEPSPMLELYRREEPTQPARWLLPRERDVDKVRLDAAKRNISAFEKQWSKQK
ncbi:hypothetical protein F5Y07DRAFT_394071 [Xylaria sp. FL0933]|nr:hypothetical protein F5Y07DRAFT_394071 [Xylaria sp. FL0933]